MAARRIALLALVLGLSMVLAGCAEMMPWSSRVQPKVPTSILRDGDALGDDPLLPTPSPQIERPTPSPGPDDPCADPYASDCEDTRPSPDPYDACEDPYASGCKDPTPSPAPYDACEDPYASGCKDLAPGPGPYDGHDAAVLVGTYVYESEEGYEELTFYEDGTFYADIYYDATGATSAYGTYDLDAGALYISGGEALPLRILDDATIVVNGSTYYRE